MSFTAISHNTIGLFERTQGSGANSKAAGNESDFWGKEGFSFESFLDTVNPFQQIPIVSTIYRAVTGDTISTGARLAGGAIFGGPLGFASALANVMVEAGTGEDIGGNVLSALGLHNESASTLTSASEGFAENNVSLAAYKRSAYLAYSRASKLS